MNIREEAKEQNSVINAITKICICNPEAKLSQRAYFQGDRTNGTTIPITYNPCQLKSKYTDECTGEILDPAVISDAIIDELDELNDRVWRIEDKAIMICIKIVSLWEVAGPLT